MKEADLKEIRTIADLVLARDQAALAKVQQDLRTCREERAILDEKQRTEAGAAAEDAGLGLVLSVFLKANDRKRAHLSVQEKAIAERAAAARAQAALSLRKVEAVSFLQKEAGRLHRHRQLSREDAAIAAMAALRRGRRLTLR